MEEYKEIQFNINVVTHGRTHIESRHLYGFFTLENLHIELLNGWIPFMECHHCPKSTYCKYVEPHNANPQKFKEIQCGVASDALKNILKIGWNLLDQGDDSFKEDYLNAAFYLVQFIGYSENYNGSFINDGVIEHYSSYAPALIGNISTMRDMLDKASFHLMNLPDVLYEQNVLLVEGESEEIFLKGLQLHRTRVRNYHGEGNIQPKKIKELLNEYRTLGLTPYIQGDMDGKNTCILDNVVVKNDLKSDQVFKFKYDFESSVPAKILYLALVELNIVSREYLNYRNFMYCYREKRSIVKSLKDNHDIDIDPHKTKIARLLSMWLKIYSWNFSEKVRVSELGKFAQWASFKQHV